MTLSRIATIFYRRSLLRGFSVLADSMNRLYLPNTSLRNSQRVLFSQKSDSGSSDKKKKNPCDEYKKILDKRRKEREQQEEELRKQKDKEKIKAFEKKCILDEINSWEKTVKSLELNNKDLMDGLMHCVSRGIKKACKESAKRKFSNEKKVEKKSILMAREAQIKNLIRKCENGGKCDKIGFPLIEQKDKSSTKTTQTKKESVKKKVKGQINISSEKQKNEARNIKRTNKNSQSGKPSDFKNPYLIELDKCIENEWKDVCEFRKSLTKSEQKRLAHAYNCLAAEFRKLCKRKVLKKLCKESGNTRRLNKDTGDKENSLTSEVRKQMMKLKDEVKKTNCKEKAFIKQEIDELKKECLKKMCDESELMKKCDEEALKKMCQEKLNQREEEELKRKCEEKQIQKIEDINLGSEEEKRKKEWEAIILNNRQNEAKRKKRCELEALKKRCKEKALQQKCEEEALRRKCEEESMEMQKEVNIRKQQEEAFKAKQKEAALKKRKTEEAWRKKEEALKKKKQEDALKKKQEKLALEKKQKQDALKKKREEKVQKKKSEEEARRKKCAEAIKKRQRNDVLKKKCEEEALRKKCEEMAQKKKLEKEAQRKKCEEEALKKKCAEKAFEKQRKEEALKKMCEERALKKKCEEEAEKKKCEEETLKKKCKELAQKRKRENEAQRKKRENEAQRKKQENEAQRKKCEEEANKKKCEEEVNKNKCEELAQKKKREEDAQKKKCEELAQKRKREKAAQKKKREEQAKEKQRKEALKKKRDQLALKKKCEDLMKQRKADTIKKRLEQEKMRKERALLNKCEQEQRFKKWEGEARRKRLQAEKLKRISAEKALIKECEEKEKREAEELKKRQLEKALKEQNERIRCCLFKTLERQEMQPGCKVSIIGTGAVGMACAITLLSKGVTNNITLYDTKKDLCNAERMDLLHGSLFVDGLNIKKAESIKSTKDSRVVVVATGAKSKPDESRQNVAQHSADIIKQVMPELVKQSPKAIFLIVTDPTDTMAWVARKVTNLPYARCFSPGCHLDTARFRMLIAHIVKVSTQSVDGYIIGEHGGSSVPLWSTVMVGGIPFNSLLPDIGTEIDPMRWSNVHMEVVKAAENVSKVKGYTNWGVGLSVTDIISAIFQDSNRILTLSTNAKDMCDIEDEVFLSLPCIVNKWGLQAVIHPQLTEWELKMLRKSAEILLKAQCNVKI